jgi:hypothetical protein
MIKYILKIFKNQFIIIESGYAIFYKNLVKKLKNLAVNANKNKYIKSGIKNINF